MTQNLFGLLNVLDETDPLGLFLDGLQEALLHENETDINAALAELIGQPADNAQLWNEIQKLWGNPPCINTAADAIHGRIDQQRAQAPQEFSNLIIELASLMSLSVEEVWLALVAILNPPGQYTITEVWRATLERWGQDGSIDPSIVAREIQNQMTQEVVAA